MFFRRILTSAILCVLFFSFSADALLLHGSGATQTIANWAPIKVGSGGLVQGLDIANDGTKVETTDTFGCYVFSAAQNKSIQLLTTSTFPVGTGSLAGGPGGPMGCDFIGIAPGNSQIIYVMWQGNLFKSTNQGATLSATNFPAQNAVFILANSGHQSYARIIAIDPANPNIVYVSTPANGLYVTTDGGNTWAEVAAVAAGLPINNPGTPGSPSSATSTTSNSIGSGTKTFTTSVSLGYSPGNFVQIWETSNPANQILGTVTSDSGASLVVSTTNTQGSGSGITDWSISAQNNISGGHRIAFDTSGGTGTGAQCLNSVSTCTLNVFVGTYNVNIWKSTTGGQSFTPVTATGRPSGLRQMDVDPFGVLWVADDDYPTTNTNIDKFDTATWTSHINVNTSNNPNIFFAAIAIDQANSTVSKATVKIAAVGTGGALQTFYNAAGGSGIWNLQSGVTYNSDGGADVTWLTDYFIANPSAFFGVTTARFDPSNSGRLYIGSEGLWYTIPSTTGSSLTASQQSRGIEEFIAIKAISPTANNLFLTSWDFPCFSQTVATFNTFPTTMTCQPGDAQTQLQRGYSVDWVWNTPNTMASVVMDGTGDNSVPAVNFSGLTTTGGATPAAWTPFGNVTEITLGGVTNPGGCIAASSPSVLVFVAASFVAEPLISTNGGASWSDISVTGGTPAGDWGPFSPPATFSKMCESDKANGDVYLYNVNKGSGDGMYKMAAATQVWTLQSTPSFGAPNNNINEQLKSSGVVGNIFFTPGLQGTSHPNASTPFYFSTNGFASKSTVTGFLEVITYAFGATWPGQSYPGFYAAGWFTGTELVNGVSTSVTNMFGVHMCKNFNSSTGACSVAWSLLGICDTTCVGQKQLFPGGVITLPADMTADPATPGLVEYWTSGGAFWIQGSFLLKRDFDPASNDNDPVGLEKAA
jgi:hypothetical protein